jgi:hypothetical protein
MATGGEHCLSRPGKRIQTKMFIHLSLPGMDGMPEGKENSNCWGSSNGYENDPRSLPVRLVVVPFVPGVPTILLAWLDGPAEREVRGCPRMSPSRNK